MLPSFASQTITRIRPATKTLRGSTVPDWDNVQTITIEKCVVQPSTTGLSQDGRVLGINEGFTVYLPPNADVQAGDRIGYDGDTYTILGKPKPWVSATGRVSHIQLSIERWDG